MGKIPRSRLASGEEFVCSAEMRDRIAADSGARAGEMNALRLVAQRTDRSGGNETPVAGNENPRSAGPGDGIFVCQGTSDQPWSAAAPFWACSRR